MPDQNPYCMRCGRHLGMPFHETSEHDEAARIRRRHTDIDTDTDKGELTDDHDQHQ